MEKKIKRVHSAEFKTTVILELLRENETLSQVSSKFGIHPTQVRRWKERALEILKTSFNDATVSEQLKEKDSLIEELYKQIGQLKVELDWLKKKFGFTA